MSCFRNRALLAGVLAVLCAAPALAAELTDIRWSSVDGRTRVVLDLSSHAPHSVRALENPPRVVVEFTAGAAVRVAGQAGPRSVADGWVERIRVNELQDGRVQVVLDLGKDGEFKNFPLDNPPRIVVDVPHQGKPTRMSPPTTDPGSGVAPSAPPARSGPATPGAKKPAVPVVEPPRHGTWKIAIDAGHGGEDPGAVYHRTAEKDLTLALAVETRERLNEMEGIEAFLVRRGDYFIPLHERYRIAEEQGAHLFVSIHCNSSEKSEARGTEVYFLSLKGASDQAARELAAKENAVDENMGIESPDLVNSILEDMTRTDVMQKSEMLAEMCLQSLFDLGTVEDRGVKQAGFVVLKSLELPSILVEAAFISNKHENKLLRDTGWQKEFGRLLAEGVRRYVASIESSDGMSASTR